jgi:diaminopimelate decarboxylase
LNFDIGNGVVSRFGFDVNGEDYQKMKQLIKESANLTLVGVHCHISKARELPFWEKRIEGIIKCVNDLKASGCMKKVEYIDLGSNLYGSMEPCLAEQFGEYIPTFDDYADVICKPLYHAFRDRLPMLILEPGTPTVANAMGVLATVVGKKTVQGKTFLMMDCSKFNLGAIAGVKNVPIKVYRFSEGEHVENADMVGYTCIEDDVVYHGFTGEIGVGDKVLFKNVGAYSNTFSPQFIMPTIGMVEDNGKVLKRRDAYKDVFGRYQ